MTKNELLLGAPVSGVTLSLENVPDAAFAQNLVGVGIAIDPTSQEIIAPCDGRIVQVHPSRHAVALKSPEGVEILIHVGLDTVKLRGEGFETFVKLGDEVKRGQRLIGFDSDLIARKAKSLMTEIVITNIDDLEGWDSLALQPRTTSAGESIIRARLKPTRPPEIARPIEVTKTTPSNPATSQQSKLFEIKNATGLHARPAALLSSTAKRFRSETMIVKGDRSANLRSLIAIMSLEVAKGDYVRLVSSGPDAVEALQALTDLVQNGLGEGPTPMVPETKNKWKYTPPAAPAVEKVAVDPFTAKFTGVSASPGIACGKIFQLRSLEIQIKERGQSPTQERERLEIALREGKLQLELLMRHLQTGSEPDKALIFSAHQELLEDPTLLDLAQAEINKGKSAEFAWKVAFTTVSARLEALNNQLLAARANDARDVGQRILRLLAGAGGVAETNRFPEKCIVIAEDLTPSDVATVDPSRVLGLVTTTGGATSHVAILARSLDIPSLAGADPRVLNIANGTLALIDATHGEIRLNPSAEEMARFEAGKSQIESKRKEERGHATEPAVTTDGQRIHVVANLKGESEAASAVKNGAEGVGLLRTEFLFMNRETAPTENEQLAAYLGIVREFAANSPLIIRTLDVGGDKPLKYLPIAKEENPFLGERGLRVFLNRPEFFREQARAILKASAEPNAQVKIMFPMVTTIEELKQAKALLEEERLKLGIKPISIGIMVEVPSAALLANHFASECDFFSIGSNDLTQYALAIDRGHPKLAAMADGLDPSVLRLIDMTVRGAREHKKWVGVCGGIASDPTAVPILLGLGVEELSVSIPAIPAIKALIRRLSLKQCQQIAAKTLNARSAAEVREIANAAIETASAAVNKT